MSAGMEVRPARVLRDVVFGEGGVGWSTSEARQRPLAMDVYLPADPGNAPRPGLVLAFGGAFHRGSKENDSFESEAGNTSIAEYCARFARLGYVCFSIDYRLVPEDPDPGRTLVVQEPEAIPTSRVAVVRRLMGLPPATPAELWRGIEAASDDMAQAIRFIRAHAGPWNLDPDRLAVGGFSAGARTALNAAFGERASVAAVVSLSGYMDIADLSVHLARSPSRPPVLLVHAERDLDYVATGTPALAAALRRSGVHCEQMQVLDAGHFYRAEATGRHETHGAVDVEQAMRLFLKKHL